MPPRAPAAAAPRLTPPGAQPGPPPPPPPPVPTFTASNIAVFAVLLVFEAVLLVALLRRVESPDLAVATQDLSSLEYLDLDTVTVSVRPSASRVDFNLRIRVDASLLVAGDAADRAKARDEARTLRPRIADLVQEVVGAQTADQAIDPGNRERLKTAIRDELNRKVFQRDVVKEVVFRYYGP